MSIAFLKGTVCMCEKVKKRKMMNKSDQSQLMSSTTRILRDFVLEVCSSSR